MKANKNSSISLRVFFGILFTAALSILAVMSDIFGILPDDSILHSYKIYTIIAIPVTLILYAIFISIRLRLQRSKDYYQANYPIIARGNEVLVLVAPFEHRGGEPQSPSGYILNELEQCDFDSDVTIYLLEEPIRSSSEAKRIGNNCKATLLIWGWYDTNGVTTQLTLTKSQELVQHSPKTKVQPLLSSNPDEFTVYITKTLPATMTFFTQFVIGQIYYFSGQSDKAIELFKKALKVNLPKSDEESYLAIFHYLGTIYGQQLEDYQKAISYFDKSLSSRPNDYSTYNNRGLAYQGSGDLEKALNDYSRSLEINPTHMSAYYNRASVHHKLGDLESAIRDYTRAIELKPDDVWSYNNRGLVYLEQGNYDRAFADFGRALQLDPKHISSLRNRASAHIKLRNYRHAYRDLKLARKYGLSTPEFYALRAYIRSEQNLSRLAIQDYTAAVDLGLDNQEFLAGVLNNRGLCFYELGAYREAIDDYTQAIEMKPSTILYKNRGSAYQKIGNYEKSVEDFSIVLQHDPENVRCRAERAFSHFMLHNFEAAKEDLSNIAIDNTTTENFVHQFMALLDNTRTQSKNGNLAL